MKTIWKLRLEPVMGIQTVELPKDAEILCVQTQADENRYPDDPVLKSAYIWALVDNQRTNEPRNIVLAWTGKEFPETKGNTAYIGSVQMNGLVWHVFEAK